MAERVSTSEEGLLGSSVAASSSDAAVPADLFPLPITPLEHFLIVDETPEQPMSAFVQLSFRNGLDLDRLRVALRQAVHRNPLLAARLIPHGPSWAWNYDPNHETTIRLFQSDPPVVDGRIRVIDLCREPGMRVWYDEAGKSSRLIFQFHHACADGIGMRRFVLDLLICYERAFAAADDPVHAELRLDRLDHRRLRERGSLKHLEDSPPAKPLTLWQRTKNSFYFFYLTPKPLLGIRMPAALANPPATSLEPIETVTLASDDSARMLGRARSEGLALNDLGLALLFHQTRQWHEQQGTRGRRQRIRLLMPLDIRTREDLRLSAANRLSFAFLGRTHHQCKNWQELLQSVQAETRTIKESRVYLDFLRSLRAIHGRPELLRRMVRRNRNMATAVFTYAGDMHRGVTRIFAEESGATRIGDALLEGIVAAPPVRSHTNISIGFVIAHSQISLSASWNREVFTADDAREFLSQYAQSWRNWSLTGEP